MRGLELLALATAVLGVAVSVLLWHVRTAWEGRALEEAFKAESAHLTVVVEREVNLFLDVLDSLGRLHGLSSDVDQQAFAEFVKKGLLYHKQILGVFGWAPRVSAAERGLYEEAMRRSGSVGFEIRQRQGGAFQTAGPADDYFPVSYTEPSGIAELPLGLDLASDPENLSALVRARDTGRTSAGDTIRLPDEPLEQSARLLFSPIYRSDAPIRGEAERRTALLGYVLAVLQPSHLLKKAMAHLGARGIDFQILDEAWQRYLFIYSADGSDTPDKWGGLLAESTIDVGGRPWRIVSRPSAHFIRAHHTWQPWGLLVGGLVITALLTMQVALIGSRTREIERTVRERTAELTGANAELRRLMEERRRLEQELLEVSSREKQRIGQDLHDSLGQKLTGAGYLSSALAKKLAAGAPEESDSASKINAALKDAIAQVRRIARGLAPVEMAEGGLSSALTQLAEDAAELFNVACMFTDRSPGLIYDKLAAINLYHIAQEAVTNAARHGKASSIEIFLSADKAGGELRIEDDGGGIPQDADSRGGMGLRIMRYRADMIGGRLSLLPRPGGGTVVRCEFESGGAQIAQFGSDAQMRSDGRS